MPTYLDITANATRTVLLDIRGVPLSVTESLLRSPDVERKNRTDMQTIIDEFDAAIKDAQTVSTDDAIGSAKVQLATLKAALKQDPRKQLCTVISSRVTAWDLTGTDGPYLLTATALYEGDLATEFLDEVLDKLQKEPLIPN